MQLPPCLLLAIRVWLWERNKEVNRLLGAMYPSENNQPSHAICLPGCLRVRRAMMRSRYRGFHSWPQHCCAIILGQVVHTFVPLSSSSIIWHRCEYRKVIIICCGRGVLGLRFITLGVKSRLKTVGHCRQYGAVRFLKYATAETLGRSTLTMKSSRLKDH